MATVTEPATAADEDFYELEALLEPTDRALLHRVRAFMRAEVEPIINDYWTRAEFPFEILPGLRGARHRRARVRRLRLPRPRPPAHGMVAMELARVDPSIATFMGVHGGLADGLDPALRLARSRRSAGCRRWRGWS